jgi:hypothetical protein
MKAVDEYSAKRKRVSTVHYTTLHYTTLHYTTLHYTTLHYTTLHYSKVQYSTDYNGRMRDAISVRSSTLHKGSLSHVRKREAEREAERKGGEERIPLRFAQPDRLQLRRFEESSLHELVAEEGRSDD